MEATIKRLTANVKKTEAILRTVEGFYAAKQNKTTTRALDLALLAYATAQKDLREALRGYRQTYPHPCAFRRCSAAQHTH
jgi:hypothetical protein